MRFLLALLLLLLPEPVWARIHRSYAAVHAFEVSTGYPHGRKGYIVDHILPLACGGKDVPENMEWQTVVDAKAKDRWEIKGDATHQPCSGLRQ